ncbi:MAG TPA: hypothetical protein VHE30_21080 [Polyangiaceae bacterium]|nr:hypothetical protein [Polyangiaceae bacterium]
MAGGRARAARSVGRYELVHELSQSYLGPLWAARIEGDLNAGLAMIRLVSLARLDADTRVRLLEAAWQAMEVRDDGVSAVTDVVASDGELGIVSEYVEGVALRGLASFASVRRKPAPPPVALRITLDLIAAVRSLHHTTAELGDEAVPLWGGLSADSVLVTAAGKTLILDVAIASAAAPIESLGGNPERTAYAAPEQLATPPKADARTDVFTIGVLCWELLSSRRLFVGSDKGVAQKVLASKIPRPDELRKKGDPEMPAGLVQAVMKALEREPAARFESVDALAQALEGSGVTPANHDAVAEYVNAVAEGALARAREALRTSPSGTRSAVPARAEPKAKPAVPEKPKVVAQAPAKPVMPARADTKLAAKPAIPVRPEGKPAIPVRPEGKPAIPIRPEGKPAARPEPRPQIRARQPTMIGIPAPAVLPSPDSSGSPARAAPAAAPTLQAQPEPAPESAVPSSAIEIVPESVAPSAAAPARPGGRDVADSSSGEEPTGQYSSRELLRQVEAMRVPTKRPSDLPGVTPTPAPSHFPGASPTPLLNDLLGAGPAPMPGEFLDASPTPPPSDFPEPATAPRLDASPLPVPADAGWLDDPASLPPPPPSGVDRDATTPDDPAEVAPFPPPPSVPSPIAKIVPIGSQPLSAQRGTAPAPVPSRTPEPAAAFAQAPVPAQSYAPTPAGAFPERTAAPSSLAPRAAALATPSGGTPRPAASLPPAASPAYLPSQIPPPLFHDPRARVGAKPERKAREQRKSSGVLLGLGLSLVLVVASAGLGIWILKGREKPEAPQEPAAAESEVKAAPAVPATATPPAAPATSAEPRAAAEPSAVAPEAKAAEPATAPSAEPAAVATPPATPAPRAALPVTRPAPAKKAAPKKKARYVPDDI